jgi:metallo-beta-lactamase class B
VILRVLLLLSALWLAAAGFAAEPDSISATLTLTTLDSGVYVITDREIYPSNDLLVELRDSTLVLVDVPYTSHTTRDLLAWMRKRFGARKTIAVNGHFHADCLGGNEELIRAGIPVHGADATVKLLAERGEAMRALTLNMLPEGAARSALREQRFVPPDHVFPLDSGLTLRFGADSVLLYYPGAAHARDNIVVWFPSRSVLFGGCMLLAGERVGNTSDADLAAWPQSVAKLRRFDARWMIPGHGQTFTPDLLEHTLDVLKK